MPKNNKKRLESKIFMGIFIIAAYFTGLWIVSAVAYADLEVCKTAWSEAFRNAAGPVGYVINK